MTKSRILLILASIIALTSCQQSSKKKIIEGEAQGTYYKVTYYDGANRDFSQQIDSILKAFDKSVSLWEENSLISRINRNETTEVDSIIIRLIGMSDNIVRNTGGAYDITIGKLVETWGFHKKQGQIPDSMQIKNLLRHVGFDKIKIEGNQIIKSDSAVHIDFNAIAQGYSVDIIASFLKSKGVTSLLVDVGGEVYGYGKKTDGSEWMVGVEKPTANSDDARSIQLVLPLKNKAIATSGNYRKYIERNGQRFSHTIDPATGYPVNHNVLSVSVIGPDAATADAYATAFMVMGIQKATKLLDNYGKLDAYFIYSGSEGTFKTYATPGMQRLINEGDSLQKLAK